MAETTVKCLNVKYEKLSGSLLVNCSKFTLQIG